MSEQIEHGIASLLNDPAFEELKLSLNRPNFFEVLGLAKREIRHSNFLGWLLNPEGNHGLRTIFLERFLRDILAQSGLPGLGVLEVESTDMNSVDIRREWRHIDILVKTKRFVILVENKIDTQDHSEQLSRYKRVAQEEFGEVPIVCVYLTPDGGQPREDAGYLTYSYGDVLEHLKSILSIHSSSLSNRQVVYLEDYITVLSRHIMKDDRLNELVERLYKRHQTAIDFIVQNLPDAKKEVRTVLEGLISDAGWIQCSTNNSYVRFLTPTLHEKIRCYETKNGWKHGESMLLEFVININNSDTLNLGCKTVISPGGLADKPYRNGLIKAMSQSPGASKPNGNMWVVHFSIKKRISNITELSAEEKRAKFDDFLPEVTSLVQRIEEGLMPYLDSVEKEA